ncbi:hypothetical protein QTG54_010671 [Skeletonema marinoi]|uniref:N-acetyltransferase domain-containing protein n=1 Tax=Skeletonema marinoi TaxID=267567 RepID=A0AAD9D8Y4_9STRA|nr:hypothetical protein QTG54_010671 [Skeletonema marinoi]
MDTPSPPQTLARFLPATLQSNGMRCRDETPTSAQELLARGQLDAKDFIEVSPDIENTLMEAFIEDDYDGRLHLMTLSMMRRDVDDDRHDIEEIIGVSFWREVPADEMGDWFDVERISKMITKSTIEHENDSDYSNDVKCRMKLVRSSSIKWIQNALASTDQDKTDTKASIDQLTHSWVKIELIAIKQSYRAHHLGNILLGCTLAKAHEHNEHAILHVAGGGSKNNIPAAKLYGRFGFVTVPRHDEGGPFAKPDKDLFVLGNIGKALNDLPFEEMLQIK